jgi:hypothetical protein
VKVDNSTSGTKEPIYVWRCMRGLKPLPTLVYRLRSYPVLALALCAFIFVHAAGAQGNSTPDANSKRARAALDAMVQAMGGERWLNLQNSYVEGRTSGF